MHTSMDQVFRVTQLWMDINVMSVDASAVVAMRMLGMSGLWTVPRNEHVAMWGEKAPAFTEATLAALLTAMAMRTPDHVARAFVDPISSKARANRHRLVREGPRLPLGAMA